MANLSQSNGGSDLMKVRMDTKYLFELNFVLDLKLKYQSMIM